jgi:NADPH:quinone reductase-like Zn-dependent oxidoreductase
MNIPEKMVAVHLEEPGGSLTTRIITVPRPEKGEVLVKISAAPINPSDLQRIKSVTGGKALSSFVPGIEGSGTVVAAGKGLLPGLWMGKRVACSSVHPYSGTWADYMVTSASFCFPITKSISDEQGSMLLVNPMTAVAFFDIVRHEKHKAVVNSAAAGALGKMIRILGKKYNIPVINVVRNELQVTNLIESGSEFVLNNSDSDFDDKLRLLSEELGATLALDPISGRYTQQLLEALPYGSTVLIYGNLSDTGDGTTLRPLLLENKKLHGFYLVNWMKDNGMLRTILNINKVRQLLKNDFSITVQNRFPLDQTQLAIDTYLGNMTAGKVLLVPGSKKVLN